MYGVSPGRVLPWEPEWLPPRSWRVAQGTYCVTPAGQASRRTAERCSRSCSGCSASHRFDSFTERRGRRLHLVRFHAIHHHRVRFGFGSTTRARSPHESLDLQCGGRICRASRLAVRRAGMQVTSQTTHPLDSEALRQNPLTCARGLRRRKGRRPDGDAQRREPTRGRLSLKGIWPGSQRRDEQDGQGLPLQGTHLAQRSSPGQGVFPISTL